MESTLFSHISFVGAIKQWQKGRSLEWGVCIYRSTSEPLVVVGCCVAVLCRMCSEGVMSDPPLVVAGSRVVFKNLNNDY